MGFTSDYESSAATTCFEAISRFDPCFDVYGLSLRERSTERDRTVTIIARSPASPVARALAGNLARFERGYLRVALIFAQIAPVEALNFSVEAIRASCSQPPHMMIRWARNRALLDAHERMTLGEALLWTGDSMRRAADARPAIDTVEDGTLQSIAEAHASFEALWRASRAIPAAAFHRLQDRLNAAQCWPAMMSGSDAAANVKVIALDEYLRLRRH